MGASSLALKTAAATDASALPTTAGGTGNGDGGEIYLNNYITVDPVAILNTIRKGTGKGGQFTAFSAYLFDVNRLVSADSGQNAQVTVQSGSITLNSVPCGQWKAGAGTGNTSWPFSYWNCVNPTNPNLNPLDLAPIAVTNGLSLQNIKATYGANPVSVYVFNTQTNFQSFFATTIGQVAAVYRIAISKI